MDEEDEERLEKEFSTAYHLVTRDDRLDSVARDIARHFVGRGPKAKAMVVSIDKKTTVRTYDKVMKYLAAYRTELETELAKETVDAKHEEIAEKIAGIASLDATVVLSLGDEHKEVATFREMGIDFKPVRDRMVKEDLETAFKEE